jgi:hypothetical protein
LTGTFTPAQVAALPLMACSVVAVGSTFNNSSNALVMDGPKGSWRLAGGTISNGSITASGAGPFSLVEGSGGTFTGVAINTYVSISNGSLTFAGTNSSGRISTTNSLLRLSGSAPTLGSIEMSGGTLTIRSRNFLLSDLLNIQRSHTLFLLESGIGTNSGSEFVLQSSVGGLKMVGGTIVGGTISSLDGTAIDVSTDTSPTQSFGTVPGAGTLDSVLLRAPLNLNMITKNGTWGTFKMLGSWRNQSTITLSAGTLALGGSFTVGDMGTIVRNGGALTLMTTLNNGGGTLNLSDIGTLSLDGGTIVGGTIVGTESNGLRMHGLGFGTSALGTLDAVTLSAPLGIEIFAVLTIQNGLTLDNGTIGGLRGSGTIVSAQSQSIIGNGTVQLGEGKSFIADAGTAIIGTGVTVRSYPAPKLGAGIVKAQPSGAIEMRGLMLADGIENGLDLSGSITNHGIFQARNGGTMSLPNDLTNFVDGTLTGGTWSIGANSTMTFGSSTITTNGANILLDGVGSTFAPINQLRNNMGLFSIGSGRNFSSVGSLTNSGTINIGSLSTLSVLDSIDNASGLIDLSCKMIVDYSGASPLSDLVGQIGTHIISSAANANPDLAIGSMDDGNVVLLQLTTLGDANLDGAVNYADLVALSQNYQSSSLVGPGWTGGDFNYDGSVNLTDLYSLGYQYNDPLHPLPQALESLGLPAIEVPEPAFALLLATAAWPLFGRAHHRLQRPRKRRRARN